MTTNRPPEPIATTDRPRRRRRRILAITLSVMTACLLISGGALALLVYAVPLDLATDRTAAEPAVIVEASDGTLIGLRGELRGTAAAREDLPDHLVNAIVAIEDRRFFDHASIDVRGVARAAWRNVQASGVVEGGSTITQQLCKRRGRSLNARRILHRCGITDVEGGKPSFTDCAVSYISLHPSHSCRTAELTPPTIEGSHQTVAGRQM